MSRKIYRKDKQTRFYKRKGFWIFVAVCVLIGIIGLFVIDATLDKYRDQADAYDLDRINDVEVPSLIVDKHGQEIGRVFVENRSLIPRTAIPENMIRALVSGEDQRFMTHDGVDYRGILRAVYLNVKVGEQTQGASTVTQQLARNAFNLKTEASKREQSGYERKLVEAFLAQRIEGRYSKDEILTFYLNRIPFGSGFYGLRSASLGYFGKEPAQLTTSECASLVGCIKNPSTYSPLNSRERNKKSRNNVLRRMVDDGFLESADAERMKEQPVVTDPKPLRRGTSHFYGLVLQEIRELKGEEFLTAGGYRIHTTIDSTIQNAAERALRQQLSEVEGLPQFSEKKYSDFTYADETAPSYLQGAALVMDNTSGKVLAYVGGRDYSHSQYDFIMEGRRPLGTAFLPFVYAAAFSSGFSPVSLVLDDAMDNRTVMVGGTEGILAEWGMESMNPVYKGQITARRALESSKIAASVRLGTDVGIAKVGQMATAFGLKDAGEDLLPRMLVGFDSASLPEVVHAYGAIANLGEMPPELEILERIEDSSGEVIYRSERRERGARVMDQDTAFQLHSVLAGAAEGQGNLSRDLADFRFDGAVKTGTTHNFTDNWAVGYNSRLTCAVWAGFLDRGSKRIYDLAFAKDTTLPVWESIMRTSQLTHKGTPYKPTAGLESVNVCGVSGGLGTRFCYEDVFDPETGATQSVSTTYTEHLRQRKDSLSYCTIHGEGVSGLAKLLEDFAPDRAPADEKAVLAVPITPKALPLIGEDPYRSQMPDLVASRDFSTPQINNGLMFFDSEVPGETEAQLRMKTPGRMRISLE